MLVSNLSFCLHTSLYFDCIVYIHRNLNLKHNHKPLSRLRFDYLQLHSRIEFVLFLLKDNVDLDLSILESNLLFCLHTSLYFDCIFYKHHNLNHFGNLAELFYKNNHLDQTFVPDCNLLEFFDKMYKNKHLNQTFLLLYNLIEKSGIYNLCNHHLQQKEPYTFDCIAAHNHMNLC